MEATLTSQEMVANKQRAVYNLSEDEKALKGRFLNRDKVQHRFNDGKGKEKKRSEGK